MAKVILVYANCANSVAKGDFSLAGGAARDIACELSDSDSDIEVILTSDAADVWKYHVLYGRPVDGKVKIDGISIKVQAIEEFDAVGNEVTALVEGGCKCTGTDIVKRVLSSQTKIVFLRAANQKSCDRSTWVNVLNLQQPEVYPYFDDIQVITTGLGPIRDGLPRVKQARELGSLSATEQRKIPSNNYGFVYFSSTIDILDSAGIAQYMAIAKQKEYVLVGGFEGNKWLINSALSREFQSSDLPTITFYPSLDNLTMRHAVVGSSRLVGSTGVMSTIEAMHDGKLPYYQYMDHNENFSASYLDSVRRVIGNRGYLAGKISGMIIALAQLLFRQKPLEQSDSSDLQRFLRLDSVSDELVDINHEIIDQANGKMVSAMMRTINGPGSNSKDAQIQFALRMLRKPGEMISPPMDQALRRAAFWQRPFELRVLLQNIILDEINQPDTTDKKRSSLHWAVLGGNFDCVALLLRANADVNAKDGLGKTALDYARAQPVKAILLLAGAKLSSELVERDEDEFDSVEADQTVPEIIDTGVEAPTTAAKHSATVDDVKVAQLALLAKINDYIRWSKNKDCDDGRNYALGFFSKWRHGDFGVKRAEELIRLVSKARCKKDMVETLQQHFSKNSKVENHSLDTYVLEAIDTQRSFFKTTDSYNLRDKSQRTALRDSFCHIKYGPAPAFSMG